MNASSWLHDLILPPNLLSLLRILLIPPIVLLLDHDTTTEALALGLLLLLVILSDYGDGILARRLGMVTPLGKVLDPLVDKILVIAIAFALVPVRGFPLWLALFLLARDVLIVAGGLLLARRIRVVATSNLAGKVALNVFGLLFLSYMFDVREVQAPLVWAAVAAAALSTGSYAVRLARTIRAQAPPRA